MKNLFLLVLIFFQTIMNSQSEGRINYRIISNLERVKNKQTNNKNEKNAKKLIIEAMELAESFDYILEFKNDEAIYYLNKQVQSDQISQYLYPIAIALTGKGLFYQNKNDNQNIHKVTSLGQTFLINDSFEKKWKILSEKRKIGDYICFKAIIECDSCNTFDEVWFTPDIPISYGPLGLSGLPGLIIEVKNRNFTIVMDKFNNKLESKIKKPSQGKKVTVEEYNEITNSYRSQSRGK